MNQTIETYSRVTQGNLALTEHFRVGEFACRDGSDAVQIAKALPQLLEELRIRFGCPVTVTSGYRTQSYNTAVGGAKGSQHCLGTAADIVVAGVAPGEVARCAEQLLGDSGGIGLYRGFTHVDVRESRARWDSTSGQELWVAGFYPETDCPYPEPVVTLGRGARGSGVKWIQWQLARRGAVLETDGVFGPATRAAVLAFQREQKLKEDGLVGALTRAALRG